MTNEQPDPVILKKMTDRIAHRGPDGEGFYLDETCALGHRRLAIIDIDGGDQPISTGDGRYTIVYNGEVYNYKELREELTALGAAFRTQSDTEVILQGYAHWGKDVVLHLRGMFAFAIRDKQTGELFLARDPWGIKPLYYYRKGDVFLFGSEIKAFYDHPDFKKEFNEKPLAAYLCYNSVPTEETFFAGVRQVLPGHRLTVRADKRIEDTTQDAVCRSNGARNTDMWTVQDEAYRILEFDEKEMPLKSAVDKISAAMEESVRYHQIADVEVGSFLSSGIDSSYLVSLARPDKTYTVGYEDPRYDEIAYAKDLCEKLDITNRSRVIDREEYLQALPDILYHMDGPLADPAAIALYFVAQIASEDVKVVMSGEGADELFGGYNSYQEEVDGSAYMKIPYPLRRAASAIASLLPEMRGLNFIYRRGRRLEDEHIGLGRVFRDKEALKLVRSGDQVDPTGLVKPYYAAHRKDSTMVQRQVIDFYFWLVNDFLFAVDRNTMMFGLEARTPYLDQAVFEVARHLTTDQKVNRETTKVALRQAAKAVIPNEAYKKKKLGFPVPLREWMREGDLRDSIRRTFESGTAAQFFDKKRLMQLLERFEAGRGDQYKKVWAIYLFLTWYEQTFAEKGKDR